MQAKTCSKCGRTKGLPAFTVKSASADGRESHCRECRNKTRAAHSKRYTDAVRANKLLARSADNVDPVGIAYHACLHVASYAESKIRSIQRKSGKEAPPQLAAIRDLAAQLAKEVESHDTQFYVGYDTCQSPECEQDISSRRPGTLYCSPYCRHRARMHISGQIKRDPYGPRGSQGRRGVTKRSRVEQATKALELRRQGKTWAEIARATGYRGTGAVYNAIRNHLGIDPKTITSDA